MLSFVGVGFAVGCTVESPDGTSSQSDDVSASSRSYVTLRRDTRKCAAPHCGGWFAKNVNEATSAEKYVSALDFSAADLDAATIEDVKDAADGEVVIYGKLSAVGSNGTQKLLVTAAYRGMPGFGPATGDLFYSAADRSPQIQCFAAPCNNLTAKKLNATATTNYTRTEIEMQNRLQIDWLTERVEQGGALVAASFGKGEKESGGYESVLKVDQVFVKLPDTQGPCSEIAVPACPSGQVRTYTRSPERCMIAGECVTQHVCPLLVPYCGADYTEVALMGQNGCNAYLCDPSFIYSE